MIMQTEELWQLLELDSQAGKTGKSGWLLRLAQASPTCPLFIGLELSSQRRAILLKVPSGPMPSRRQWPRSKGFDSVAILIDGKPYFGVALKEPRFADVFTALADDIVRRVAGSDSPAEELRAFLGQLARWQKFLSVPSEGLSPQAQRGLWGELHLLLTSLIPTLGSAAVIGWKGGQKAHQDFQFATTAIEVKTTLAKLPQVVRITNERQLDDSTLPSLFLHVLALDEREKGISLPEMVSAVRAKLKTDVAASERFEDELIDAGYVDSHVTKYSEPAYAIRNLDFFKVGDGFPRLVEDDMPLGVGDANYGLSVSACRQFKINLKEVMKIVTAETPPKTKRKKDV